MERKEKYNATVAEPVSPQRARNSGTRPNGLTDARVVLSRTRRDVMSLGESHAGSLAKQQRSCYPRGAVPLRTCTVTFTNTRGIRHSADVQAESLFEAAVLAILILRRDGWSEQIGPATRLDVEVPEPVTRHTVTLLQVERWLNGATTSPNQKVRRERLRRMLTT